MDGGLAIFGFGLFLMGIANLYARTSYWLAWVLLAVSLVSMGLAFSESKRLREVALGLGVTLLVLSGVAMALDTPWWLSLGTFIFAVAYGVLWAEYRFAYFEHIGPEEAQARARVPHERRVHRHWPWQRRRVTP